MELFRGSTPHDFTASELHRRFNENGGPFTWLGSCAYFSRFYWELSASNQLKLIGSSWDHYGEESIRLFEATNSNGMILICDQSAHKPPEFPEGVVLVAIAAQSFDALNELVLKYDPRIMEIEWWLEDGPPLSLFD